MPYINTNPWEGTQWGFNSTKSGSSIGTDPFSAGHDPGSGTYQPISLPIAQQGGVVGSVNLNTIPGTQNLTVGGNPLRIPPINLTPPSAPDLTSLQNLQQKVQRKKAIDKAMADYDQLSAATQASGFQAASNASSVYSNRLLQQGQNPIASGVVAAQARLPVYRALAEIGTERDKTRIDAVGRADTLAAQIAQSIAGLQESHAKTLADFNLQQAGYNLDLSKFQEQQRLASQELAARTALGFANLGNRPGSSRSATGSDAGIPSADQAAYLASLNYNTGQPQAGLTWSNLQALLAQQQ